MSKTSPEEMIVEILNRYPELATVPMEQCISFLKREEALAKQLEAVKHRKRSLVDPLQFEMSVLGWKPVTDAQKSELEKAGIFPDSIESYDKAERLISTIRQRSADGLSTPKQIRHLEHRGFQNVGQWSYDASERLVERIALNGWKTPNGIHPATYAPEPKAEGGNGMSNEIRTYLLKVPNRVARDGEIVIRACSHAVVGGCAQFLTNDGQMIGAFAPEAWHSVAELCDGNLKRITRRTSKPVDKTGKSTPRS